VGNGLKTRYNHVYGREGLGNHDLEYGSWPRDRHEAAIHFSQGGTRVLDVGCGNGLVLYNLRSTYTELHGIELSDASANTAKETLRDLDAAITVADIERGLEYPDQHFDTIILSDVLEHLVDPWFGMAEVTRLARPRGRVLVMTPNIARLDARIKLLVGRFPSTALKDEGFALRSEDDLLDGGHLHYFTFSMLDKLFARYGFASLRHYGYGRFGRVHNLWPSLMSGSCLVVATR